MRQNNRPRHHRDAGQRTGQQRASAPRSSRGFRVATTNPCLDRIATWSAFVMLVVYWSLVAASLMLRAVTDPRFHLFSEVVPFLGYGAYPTLGALIVARQSRNLIGWLCCAVGVAIGPAAFAQAYAWYALIYRPGSLPGGLVMGWLGSWPWYLAVGLLLTFLPLHFPNGRLVSPAWRPVVWAAAATIAVDCFWAAFAPRQLEGPIDSADMPTNPWGIHGADAAFRLLAPIAVVAPAAMALLSTVSVIVRFRHARGIERQQLKWFAYGATQLVLIWTLLWLIGLHNQLPAVVTYLVALVSMTAVPVAIGTAVMRKRLYDIDKLINRTLVYGTLTALLSLGYAGSILLPSQLLSHDRSNLAIAGATLAVATLFQPARRRIQTVVDRRFNRRRYDAAKRSTRSPLAYAKNSTWTL